MSRITTHVLDTSQGRPAAGVLIALEVLQSGGKWRRIGKGVTDSDGRLRDLLPEKAKFAKGIYRLMFETGKYFAATQIRGFYPTVSVVFEVRNPKEHYHVPLLLSPYGYSTYRGS